MLKKKHSEAEFNALQKEHEALHQEFQVIARERENLVEQVEVLTSQLNSLRDELDYLKRLMGALDSVFEDIVDRKMLEQESQMELIDERIMFDKFINSLGEDHLYWLARASAGIIGADKKVTKAETEHLRFTFKFLRQRKHINPIITQLQNKQKIELEILKIKDRDTATKMLLYLVAIAITDDQLAHSETEYLIYAAGKIGFDAPYVKEYINWAKEYTSLNRRKKKLLEIGRTLAPKYSSY